MSVSGVITYGIGPKGSLQFLLLDGLSLGVAGPAPPAVVIGGMVKRRHSKRYEVLIDGVTLIGRSLPDLERKVAAWRAAHAKTEPLQRMRTAKRSVEPEPSLLHELPPGDATGVPAPAQAGLLQAPQNVSRETFVSPIDLKTIAAIAEMARRGQELDAAQQVALALHEGRMREEAAARRRADEDDDAEVLRLILEKVA